MVTMAIFLGCGLDFALRVVRDKPYAFRIKQIEAKKTLVNAAVALNSTGSEESTLSRVEKQDELLSVGKEATEGELRKWWIIMLAVFISSLMILLRGES